MSDVKANAEFRFAGLLSVDFHILGSLWIDLVGHKLEANIAESSYGCRLSRPRQQKSHFIPNYEFPNEIKPHKLQNGHFRFYVPDYQRWQNDGLTAIKNAISNSKSVVALTTDVEKFYHRVNPEFLLKSSFYEFLQVTLTSEERELTELMVSVIKSWSEYVIRVEMMWSLKSSRKQMTTKIKQRQMQLRKQH